VPRAAAQATQATLQGDAGVFTITPGAEVKAGRSGEKCVVLLENVSVSSVHASLKLEAGKLWVRDESSTHGTFLNASRLTPAAWTAVPDGARLAFGPVELRVKVS
jgi:pSer/pThr/pTyr-binding forkhead associated (FHA) protein